MSWSIFLHVNSEDEVLKRNSVSNFSLFSTSKQRSFEIKTKPKLFHAHAGKLTMTLDTFFDSLRLFDSLD